MGIYYFNTWLKNRYPLIFKDLRDVETPSVDHFYVYLNNIYSDVVNFCNDGLSEFLVQLNHDTIIE